MDILLPNSSDNDIVSFYFTDDIEMNIVSLDYILIFLLHFCFILLDNDVTLCLIVDKFLDWVPINKTTRERLNKC